MEMQKVWRIGGRVSVGNGDILETPDGGSVRETALPPMLAEILAETRPVPEDFEEVFWQNYWELMA